MLVDLSATVLVLMQNINGKAISFMIKNKLEIGPAAENQVNGTVSFYDGISYLGRDAAHHFKVVLTPFFLVLSRVLDVKNGLVLSQQACRQQAANQKDKLYPLHNNSNVCYTNDGFGFCYNLSNYPTYDYQANHCFVHVAQYLLSSASYSNS